jgi:hypothetical protein
MPGLSLDLGVVGYKASLIAAEVEHTISLVRFAAYVKE